MTDAEDRDRLIDHAARQLTDGEPSPHLRTRVLAALGERRPVRSMWLFGPAMGAAALALAVVITMTRAPATPEPRSAGTTSKAGAPGVPGLPVVPGVTSVPGKPGGRPRVTQPSAAEVAWQERAIPALVTPQALTLDRIQPEALEIRPLATTPLSVAAIGEDDKN